uniref:Hcy-binding domain-containing protein n=1 Tax=Panagrolaimus superbus TaxID=310955 RepID=A0A914YY58_9BILA
MENFILLDGGTGQMIKDNGFKCEGEALWSSAALKYAPELVKEVHESFAKAGATTIYTNTYSLHLNSIEDIPEKLGTLIAKNIDIINKICQTYDCTYRISIGPLAVKFHDASEYSGAYMKDGRATIKDVCDHYDAILGEVQKHGYKDVAFETIPTMAEVKGAIKSLKKYPRISAFLTVVPKDENETVGGDSLIEITKIIAECLQINAFGINCCNPNFCSPVAKLISPYIRDNQFLIMKPNDGRKYLPEDDCYFGAPIDMTKDLPELAANKVRYIGGCCSVRPDDIKKYARYIEEHKIKMHDS